MNTQSPCQTIEPLLTACILGELPEETAAAVKAHVASCAACREQFQTLGATLGLLGDALAPRTEKDAAPALTPERIDAIRRNLLPPRHRLHFLLPGELRRHFRLLTTREDGEPRPLGLLVLNVAAVFLVIGCLAALLLPSRHDPRMAAKPAGELNLGAGRTFELEPKLDKEQKLADLAGSFADARTTAERLAADARDEASDITFYPEGEYATATGWRLPPATGEIGMLLNARRRGGALLIPGGAATLADPWEPRPQTAAASEAKGAAGEREGTPGSIIPVRPITADAGGMETHAFPAPAGLPAGAVKPEALRVKLEALGVTFPAGASLTYNPARNKLIVRNTPQNLQKIGECLEKIDDDAKNDGK
jgi:hypothetical protein